MFSVNHKPLNVQSRNRLVDLCTKPATKALWAVCTAQKNACCYGKQCNCQYMINHSFITITSNNGFEWNSSSLSQTSEPSRIVHLM